MLSRGWVRLRVLAAGLLAGSMLAVCLSGSAAAHIYDPLTHLESGPSPTSIPKGGIAYYDIHVTPGIGSFEEFITNPPRLYSIAAVTGAAGLSIAYSPCLILHPWGPDAIFTGVAVQTVNASYLTAGTHDIQFVVAEWDSATSCSGSQQDIAPVDATITVTDWVGQTITFPQPADRAYPAPSFDLGVTVDSGLPITFSSGGPCHVTGGVAYVDGAGTCSITASQPGQLGYNAATPVTRSFNIAAWGLTLTVQPSTKVYGAPLPTFSYVAGGFPPGEDASDLVGTPEYVTGADDWAPVGTYPVSLQGLSNPNYSITVVPGTLSVTPAPLTVTADNKSKAEGDPNPPLTATITGFVLGEDSSVLSAQPTCTTTATDTSPAGTYPITCAGASASNYTFSYVGGVLTVSGEANHLVVTPHLSTLTAGGSQTYTAELFDINDVSLGDVTMDTTFTIAGGSCTLNVCTSTLAGNHTVTGTIGGLSATATLTILPGPPQQLILDPAEAYVLPGNPQLFRALILDEYGNGTDVTAVASFGIDGSGLCVGPACGSDTLGNYTVTAQVSIEGRDPFSAVATLHVVTTLPTPPPNRTPPPTTASGTPSSDGTLPLFGILFALVAGAFGLLAVLRQRAALRA